MMTSPKEFKNTIDNSIYAVITILKGKNQSDLPDQFPAPMILLFST